MYAPAFQHLRSGSAPGEAEGLHFVGEKLVREGFQFKHNTLDEIYDNVIEYGKALGILPN
jgi:anthocyanidin reductase